MTLLGAPWGISTSALCLPATSPIFFSSRFYFSSTRIPLTFFLTCCCRALVIVIHLYLCLRLPTLIWSLPRFQVHVIMFSAPGWFCCCFPRAPHEQCRGWGNKLLAPLPGATAKRLWGIPLLLFLQHPLFSLSLRLVSRESLLSSLMFKLHDISLKSDISSVWNQISVEFSSVAQSCLTLRPHELQHARLPCPSPTPKAYLNLCPSSQWCHPTISSSVVPFSSHLQSFPASGSFPVSQFFSWGGQSIGVSASASVLPMNSQDWFPLGRTGWISLQSKGLSRIFFKTTVQKHQFFGAQLSLWSNSHIHTWLLEKP